MLFNLILGFPTGLAALTYARKVDPLWQAGDQPGAALASRRARTWAIVSTVLDALGVLFVVLIIVATSAKGPFDNPANVASSLKAQIQHRLSDPSGPYYQAGVKVSSVTCTPKAANTDTCVTRLSNGQALTVTAVISDNGKRYLTH